MVEDYELPQKYFAELCYKIRTQINTELEWKFDLLVKTFKSIHKDRQSPKLNSKYYLMQLKLSQSFARTFLTQWTLIFPVLTRSISLTPTSTSTTAISSACFPETSIYFLKSSRKSSCAERARIRRKNQANCRNCSQTKS